MSQDAINDLLAGLGGESADEAEPAQEPATAALNTETLNKIIEKQADAH